jgi:hypothetical protein
MTRKKGFSEKPPELSRVSLAYLLSVFVNQESILGSFKLSPHISVVDFT